jgi:hypothetical protein
MTQTAGRVAAIVAVTVLVGNVSVQRTDSTWQVRAGGTAAVAAEQGQASAVAAGGGKIEAGKPVYRPKDAPAWKEQGRIVGPVRNAPAFTVKALNDKGDVVKTVNGAKGAKGYELDWLAPGVYTLEVSADGYATLTLRGLEVKAGNDLSVVLEFAQGA